MTTYADGTFAPPLVASIATGSPNVGDTTPLAIVASGGVPPYRAALLSGSLPRGRAISSRTMAIVGTYLGAAPAAYAVRVTDATGVFTDVSVSEAVGGGLSASLALGSPSVGDTTALAPTISGGVPPYTIEAIGGSLPLGRRVSNGSIVGKYEGAARFSYGLQITDAAGARVLVAVQETVGTASGSVTPSLPATVLINAEGDSITVGLGSTGGINSYVDRAVATGLPAGPAYTYRKSATSGEASSYMDSGYATGTANAAISVTAAPAGAAPGNTGLGPYFDPTKAMNIGSLMAGTNDNAVQSAVSVYKHNRSIIHKWAATAGAAYAPMLIGTIPSRNAAGYNSSDNGPDHNFDGNTLAVNVSIKALGTSDMGADFIYDLTTAFPTAASYVSPYTTDGTHPTDAGYAYSGNGQSMNDAYRAALVSAINSTSHAAQRTKEPLAWSFYDHNPVGTLTRTDAGTVTALNGGDIFTAPGNQGGVVVFGYPTVRSGKWAWEVALSGTASNLQVGICGKFNKMNNGYGGAFYPNSTDFGFQLDNGQVKVNGTQIGTVQTGSSSSVYQFAIDADKKLAWVKLVGGNGQWNGSATADPVAGVGGFDLSAVYNADFTSCGQLAGFSPVAESYGAGTMTSHFTAASMTGGIPSGFKALDQ